MLQWRPGPRAQDGVWAAHWYGAVHRSSEFASDEGELPTLTGRAAKLLAGAMPFYQQMSKDALA